MRHAARNRVRDVANAYRIAQLVPLGYEGTALENDWGGVSTNQWAVAQIEVCGSSSVRPYSFDSKTTAALAHLMAVLNEEAGIPLSRPFPDTMPPLPWAEETFRRRLAGHWGQVFGTLAAGADVDSILQRAMPR